MDKTTNWSEVTEPMNMEIITQTCQKFLSQLPEDQRNILLAPFTNKTPTSIPSHVQHESRSKTKTVQPKARNSSQSGSRKRRQTLHADQDDTDISDAPVTHPNDTDECQPIDKTSRSYKMLPVFLQLEAPRTFQSFVTLFLSRVHAKVGLCDWYFKFMTPALLWNVGNTLDLFPICQF